MIIGSIDLCKVFRGSHPDIHFGKLLVAVVGGAACRAHSDLLAPANSCCLGCISRVAYIYFQHFTTLPS